MEEILKDFERIPDEVAINKVKDASLEALATKHIDLTRILGEQRKAKENKLVPEYIEEFFKRVVKPLNIDMKKRPDGFWHITSTPFEVRNQPHDFKIKFGEVQREYSKVSFDKEKAFKGQAEFVAMGHPLLEACIENIFTRYGQNGAEGAVFEDPEGIRDGVIWFCEAEIKDGDNAIAGKRLFAVFQNSREVKDGLSFVNPAILWDLKPLSFQDGTNEKAKLKKDDFQTEISNPDEVKFFVITQGLENYKKELLERRKRDADIKRKYGIRSLESMILDSDAKISEYEIRRMKGENIPEPTIQNEIRKKEGLEQKKQRLLKEIEAEVHLYPTEPKIIGAARIIPGTVQGEMFSDEEIERIGMEFVMAYEKDQQREPEDVHLENLGYDIRSRDQAGAFRYIEVKARAKEGAIVLTPNEWLMAQRLKEEYWLYVVVNVSTSPELYVIHNPAECLEPAEEVSIVRYIVTGWKNKSEKA